MNLNLLRIFLLLMLYSSGNGMEEMVKLKSSQSKTSSTLRWVPSKAGKPLPHHAVPVHANDYQYVWCRGRFSTIKVPGGIVENGTCAFAFLSPSVTYADKYDILVSVDGSARVKQVEWDSLMAKPKNSLLSPERALVAVIDPFNSSISKAGSVGLLRRRSFGPRDSTREVFYPDGDFVGKSDSGLILVEDEPISYTLKDIKFKTKAHKIHTSPVTLYSTHLSNNDRSSKLVSHTFSYTLKNMHYWGRVDGTLTSLPSIVFARDEDPIDVLWGEESSLQREEFSSISYELPASSYVNVTAIGTLEDYEAPYRGILTTIYEDGFSHERPIASRHVGKVFKRVVVLFSSPIYLNGSMTDQPEKSELLYEHVTTTTTTTPLPTTTLHTTTTDTTEETTPVLIKEIFGSSDPISETPQYVSSLKFYESRKDNLTPTSETSLPLGKKHQRGSERAFEEDELSVVGPEEHRSTSDRILSALSTIFTGLVFWYFSLGIAV